MTFVNSMAHQSVSCNFRQTDNQIFVRFRSLISGMNKLRMTDPNNVKICATCVFVACSQSTPPIGAIAAGGNGECLHQFSGQDTKATRRATCRGWFDR